MAGLLMARSYSRALVHGTLQGYVYRGCRCELCRQAHREYYGHRPMAEYLADREPAHGTESRYINRGCRCDECRAAANAARRERRQHPAVTVHGRNGYGNGCRCDICREGQVAYNRERRRRIRVGP